MYKRLKYRDCTVCGGSGYSFGGQCEHCEGTGDEDYHRENWLFQHLT